MGARALITSPLFVLHSLATTRPGTAFELLADVGHCPHDDPPEEVHARLLPWLAGVVGKAKGEGAAVASA